MKVKFLKPKDGLEVYIPKKGRSIRAEGENIEVDAYVEARIQCGSLVECVKAAPKTKKQEIEK